MLLGTSAHFAIHQEVLPKLGSIYKSSNYEKKNELAIHQEISPKLGSTCKSSNYEKKRAWRWGPLFADKALCCHVRWAWRGRATAEGPVARGRAGAPRGILKPSRSGNLFLIVYKIGITQHVTPVSYTHLTLPTICSV